MLFTELIILPLCRLMYPLKFSSLSLNFVFVDSLVKYISFDTRNILLRDKPCSPFLRLRLNCFFIGWQIEEVLKHLIEHPYMNGLFFFCRDKCHSLILHPRMVFDFVYTVDNGRGCVSNSIWAVNYYCSFIFVAYFNSNFDGAF